MPREHADAILARTHQALTVTFASSNTPPAVLLRLRTWALQCLLLKTTLDSNSFWSQATYYLTSYAMAKVFSRLVFNCLFLELIFSELGNEIIMSGQEVIQGGSNKNKLCIEQYAIQIQKIELIIKVRQ